MEIITLYDESQTIQKEVRFAYAIIETGGKQIRVEESSIIFVEKLNIQEDEAVVFDKIVAYYNRSLCIGTPYVKGARVNAKVEKQGKAEKVIIYKYKAKKGSLHRKQGHRQPYTKLTIESIKAQCMVRVHVKRHQGIIQEMEIRNHAGYADAGQDLICAGVSSIVVGMMNTSDEMVPETCNFVLKRAYIKIETILPDVTVGILLQGMYYQLSTAWESYADYITINDREV